MAAGAMLITQYLWSVGEGAPTQGPFDWLMVISMVGILALTPCIAYEGSSDSPENE